MSVADLLFVDSEQWGVVWRWRRRLWQWEEELLAKCRALFLDVSLNSDVSDSWVWLLDPSHGYTVRGAYSLLTSQVPHVDDFVLDLVCTNRFPWRYQFLRGGSSVIAYQQRQIWLLDGCCRLTSPCVLLVADILKQHNISFYYVILLVRSGICFVIG